MSSGPDLASRPQFADFCSRPTALAHMEEVAVTIWKTIWDSLTVGSPKYSNGKERFVVTSVLKCLK